LRATYAHTLDAILALGAVTLCFEIVLPEYRIVVDYAGREDLVLLAAFDTDTGDELDLDEPRFAGLGFPLARRFTATTLDEAHALVEGPLFENGEGVVVRFAGGLRLKLKREEYMRLHRIVTGVTPRRIWEMLRDGSPPIGRLFAGTPESFQAWARGEVGNIEEQRALIDASSQEAYRQIMASEPPDRKSFALLAQKHRHSAILFKLYDGQPYQEMLWKLVRPGPADPFRVEV
jgi:RNA ligase